MTTHPESSGNVAPIAATATATVALVDAIPSHPQPDAMRCITLLPRQMGNVARSGPRAVASGRLAAAVVTNKTMGDA